MAERYSWPQDANNPELLRRLSPAQAGLPEAVVQAARAIIERVRTEGDAALIACAAQFDGVQLTQADLRLSSERIRASAERASPELRQALQATIEQVRRFHEPQRPKDYTLDAPGGGRIGLMWRPVAAAGLYVPGGRAAYPSTVIMNAVPAQVAGVPRLAVFTVPEAVDKSPAVAAALELLGLTEVYQIGGAQAVAAAAYGTQSVAAVQVIVGPGNAYVAAAKAEVQGVVGIDSVAGPSEVLILADDSADPGYIARDLLAQAEHDPSARCVLATPSSQLAARVEAELVHLIPANPRQDIILSAWRDHGAIIIAPRAEDLVEICARMAPEHLQVILRDPPPLDHLVAGAIFIGDNAPTAIGDYGAGPNHVLPTGGTARFSGPLGVQDFLRSTSVVQGTAAMMQALVPSGARIADHEGLWGHAEALRARLKDEA